MAKLFILFPLFITLSLFPCPAQQTYSCLRSQFRLLSSKLTHGFESVKKTSNILVDNLASSESMEPNSQSNSFEIKTTVNHFEFLKFIFHEDLALSLDDEEDILVNSICKSYLSENQVKYVVAEVLCKRFIQEDLEAIRFMRKFKHVGSKIFGDIFMKSADDKVLAAVEQIPEVEHVTIENVSKVLDEVQLAVELRKKYRAVHDQIYQIFLANFVSVFEEVVNVQILREFEKRLALRSTLTKTLQLSNMTQNAEVLEEKVSYLLLALYTTTLNSFDFTNQVVAKVKKFVKKKAVAIQESSYTTLFFKRLTDEMLISINKSHIDLSLYFELYLLPSCYRVFALSNQPKPIFTCKSTFQEIFQMFFKDANQELKILYQLYSLAPSFVHKFNYIFEKNFGSLETKYAQIKLEDMKVNTKKELLELILEHYRIMEKVNLKEITLYDSRTPSSKNTERKPDQLVYAIIPQLMLLSREYPELMFSFLGQSAHLLKLETEMKKNRWFLNSQEGRLWSARIKQEFLSINNIDSGDNQKTEFSEKLKEYSVELMGPEFQRILELADEGVPNMHFLFEFYDRKVTFKLLSRKIHNVLTLYNLSTLSPRAISLAHEQLTKMIDRMVTMKEFFYSNDMVSLFNEQEQAQILDMVFENVDSVEEEKLRIFNTGLAEYLLERRVESEYVFELGMIITFEAFHQIEEQVAGLDIDTCMKEYLKWILAHYLEFEEDMASQQRDIKTRFSGLKRHLKNGIFEIKKASVHQNASIEEETMNKSLRNLFYNSFISFEEVTDEQIDELLLHVDKLSPRFLEGVNKCASNESLKNQKMQQCEQENPNLECVFENNFVITSLCPFGTFQIPFTSRCMETCPENFAEDEQNPMLCRKPNIQFRKVLDIEHDTVSKYPSSGEAHLINKTRVNNAKVQKVVKREISQVFKKIHRDFKGRELSEEGKSNVFERKFEVSDCPANFEEFDLMCIPVCPEGWFDHGTVCVKPVRVFTGKYLIPPQ